MALIFRMRIEILLHGPPVLVFLDKKNDLVVPFTTMDELMERHGIAPELAAIEKYVTGVVICPVANKVEAAISRE